MYLSNKYTRWYNSIIANARSRPKLEGYSEGHHIIPKCLGGSNDKDNIVRLTAREHYICHLLLVKMVERRDQGKLALAATKMKRVSNTHDRSYHFSSKTYDRLKRKASEYLSELNRKRWADPVMREKLKETMSLAKTNPTLLAERRREQAEELKAAKAKLKRDKPKPVRSRPAKPKPVKEKKPRQPYRHSEETKARLSELVKNRPPISEETRMKMSVAKKNISEETRAKMRIAAKLRMENRRKGSPAISSITGSDSV